MGLTRIPNSRETIVLGYGIVVSAIRFKIDSYWEESHAHEQVGSHHGGGTILLTHFH